MKVKRQVTKVGEGLPSSSKPQYAFSNKLEALFASGILSSMLERRLPNDDTDYSPRNTSIVRTDRFAAQNLNEAVQLRTIGFQVPSAGDDVDEFLGAEQSSHMWNAIEWATDRTHYRDDGTDMVDGFQAVMAGGYVLRYALLAIEHPAFDAGLELLAREEAKGTWIKKGLGLLPQLPDCYVEHSVESVYRATTVTVVTAN